MLEVGSENAFDGWVVSVDFTASNVDQSRKPGRPGIPFYLSVK